MLGIRPLRPFLITFLPGAAGSVALGHFAEGAAPALAPAVLLSFGFLAFTLAVSVAATRPADPGKGRVLATLDLVQRKAARHDS